jgi:hypothetical protein
MDYLGLQKIRRLINGRDMSGTTDMQEIRSAFFEPVLSQLRKVRRKLKSNATQVVVRKLHYEPARYSRLNESWRKLSCANVKAFDEAVDCVKSSTELRSFQHKSYGSPVMPLRGARTRKRRMNDAALETYFQAQLFKRLKEMEIKSGSLKHQDHNWISVQQLFMFHSGSYLVSSKLSPIPYV